MFSAGLRVVSRQPLRNAVAATAPAQARFCSSSSSSTLLKEAAPKFLASSSRISAPVAQSSSAVVKSVEHQQRGMKVRSSVKKFCDGCSVVRRKGRLYVICSKDPKHKQVSFLVSGTAHCCAVVYIFLQKGARECWLTHHTSYHFAFAVTAPGIRTSTCPPQATPTHLFTPFLCICTERSLTATISTQQPFKRTCIARAHCTTLSVD